MPFDLRIDLRARSFVTAGTATRDRAVVRVVVGIVPEPSRSVRLGGSSSTSFAPPARWLRSANGRITAGEHQRGPCTHARIVRRCFEASRRRREAARPGGTGNGSGAETASAGGTSRSRNHIGSVSSYTSPGLQLMEWSLFARALVSFEPGAFGDPLRPPSQRSGRFGGIRLTRTRMTAVVPPRGDLEKALVPVRQELEPYEASEQQHEDAELEDPEDHPRGVGPRDVSEDVPVRTGP